MRALYPVLGGALVLALATPEHPSFRPRHMALPQIAQEPPLPDWATGPSWQEREAQALSASPAGVDIPWPRTVVGWDGPDLILEDATGARWRATFSDYPHQPQTLTPE